MAENVVTSRQLSLRGMEAVQQGNWELAETRFASAVEACPVDERARCRYAETLWQRGEVDEDRYQRTRQGLKSRVLEPSQAPQREADEPSATSNQDGC